MGYLDREELIRVYGKKRVSICSDCGRMNNVEFDGKIYGIGEMMIRTEDENGNWSYEYVKKID